MTCTEPQNAAKQLTDFGELKVWHGLGAKGQVFELYLSPTGTWTLVETGNQFPFAPGQMLSCLRANGNDWAQPVAAPGPEV